AGRLNTAIEGVYEGEFATLKDNVNVTAEQLRGIVEKINETGTVVTRDADVLSTNAARLSQQSA
ncbi:MAG TPA: hypothetical protein DIU07_00730, partial [Rhodobacteraceae bacterium]|nr:hypothetical protein [Paracoccaceae bacterium]